jgi:V8-like Glu-specific endopeptidase
MNRTRNPLSARLVLGGLGALALAAAALPSAAEPIAAVGRLNHAGFRTVMHCTATLIASDVALTAAHCVVREVPPENVHFLPGFAPAGWLEDLPLAGWAHDSDKRDVATLCLAGTAATVPLRRSATGPKPGEQLTAIGYPVPARYIQSRFDCTVGQVDGRGAFTLSCPLRPGASGGPVLRATDNGDEIVGVISATSETRSLAFDVSANRALPRCR